MEGKTYREQMVDGLLKLADTIDAVKAEEYADDAAELLDPAQAVMLRAAAAVIQAADDTPDLRDSFAGQVLTACQIVLDPRKDPPTPEILQPIAARFARTAYVIADAMLAERQTGGAR